MGDGGAGDACCASVRGDGRGDGHDAAGAQKQLGLLAARLALSRHGLSRHHGGKGLILAPCSMASALACLTSEMLWDTQIRPCQ